MAYEFEYKHIYLCDVADVDPTTSQPLYTVDRMVSGFIHTKDCRMSEPQFKDRNYYPSSDTVISTSTTPFNDFNSCNLRGASGYGSMMAKRMSMFTPDVNNTFKLLPYSYQLYTDGGNTFFDLYYENIRSIHIKFPTSNQDGAVILAGWYDVERNITTMRLCLVDNENGYCTSLCVMPQDFVDYINTLVSTTNDKRYYDYVAPSQSWELRSSHFKISDIESIANISRTNWLSSSGYLKDSNDLFWRVYYGDITQTTDNLTFQGIEFNRFYNTGERLKLGSNFLYRVNGTGNFINGLVQFDEHSSTRLFDNTTYTVKEDNFSFSVYIRNNNTDSFIQFKDKDNNVLDTFYFKYVHFNSNYLSPYVWYENHRTDSLFLGRVGDDYYIFGRTCDGSGFYIKPFYKLSTSLSNILNDELIAKGEAESYDVVGSELGGNESTERGIDENGNEGTWIDTDDDGVVDTFVSDKDKTQSGNRGENDATNNLSDGNTTAENTPKPHVNITNVMSSGFLSAYIFESNAEMNAFANELMSPSAWQKFKNFFSTSPLDCIYSLHLLPYRPASGVRADTTIKIGDWSTENRYKKLSSSNCFLNFGTCKIKESYPNMEFLNYTDVSVKIYLPFIGFKEVDVANVIGVTTELKYICNVITGDILATLYCDGKALYNWMGNCIFKIPFSQNDYNQVISSSISAVTSLGTSMVGFGTSNPMLGVSGLVSAGDSFVKATKPNMISSGSISGSAGIYSPTYPFYVITKNSLAFDKKFNHDIGRHSYSHKRLNDPNVKGYTKVTDIDLTNLSCTEDEKVEIRRMLLEGVYV